MKNVSVFEPETGIAFNFEKLCDVIHYVAAKAAIQQLGRVKLHKILYFADMLNYLRVGEPLTGEDYIKQKFGPTARHLNAALKVLAEQGRVLVQAVDFHGYEKYEFHAQCDPRTNSVSSEERALLDDVIDFVCGRTANEICDISHNEAWEMALSGERIPYYSAYGLWPAEITDEDRTWALREARRIGVVD